MTEYTYTVDSTNCTENVTFNLKKGDVLKITSTTFTNMGWGVYSITKLYPVDSIPGYTDIKGITIDDYNTLATNNYFFDIRITASDVNKNFEITNYFVNYKYSIKRTGGIIKIQIDRDKNTKIKVNNSYIDGSSKIKINGNWTDGSVYVKIDGSWRN